MAEDVKESVPSSVASFAACEHPGLEKLYYYWRATDSAGDDDVDGAEAARQIVEAMTIFPAYEHPGFLMCSHCRSLIPVEKFKSGELWNASAEASREAARRAGA